MVKSKFKMDSIWYAIISKRETGLHENLIKTINQIQSQKYILITQPTTNIIPSHILINNTNTAKRNTNSTLPSIENL